jgi:acyl transferase domain-containing protein
MQPKDTNDRNDIAIIGMAGRFPGAGNLEEFWENLKQGRDCIDVPPLARRENWRPFMGDSADHMPPSGYLESIDGFDAQFFGTAPGEAAYIDPAHRLLLEVIYEAMEYGGWGGDRLSGSRTGVFIARGDSGYKQLIRPADFSLAAELGNLPAVSAGRVSHLFNLQGPSLLIDTACSSSLTALHCARESIARGECDMAIAAAVNVYAYFDGKIASIDARISMADDEAGNPREKGAGQDAGDAVPSAGCRVFDDSAAGVVNGEGAAAVLLKPLARAQADGDAVCAVIRGSAVAHNGGRTAAVSGLRPEAMADVMNRALENAGIGPETLSYLEASGTSSKMGDPLEIKSIAGVFSRTTERKSFCPVGCVKNNIGHLNHTSGLAALLKTVLALQHRQIPPLARFQSPNSYIDFKNSPVFINTGLMDWEAPANRPRRAGVNSFSVSGANCHVVLEEAPMQEPPAAEPPDRFRLAVLSAREPQTLERLAHALGDDLARRSPARFGDACHTLAVGRGHHEYRLAVVCQDAAQFKDAIAAVDFELGRIDSPCAWYGHNKKTNAPSLQRAVFLFSGRQENREDMAGMYRDFYSLSHTAARYMDQCRQHVEPDCWERDPRARYFAFQYALAALLRDLGVKPAFVLGFGVGKYVAKAVSGKLPVKEALDACLDENPGGNSFNGDKFKQGVEHLYAKGQTLFLETGPTAQLGALARKVLEGKTGASVMDCFGREDYRKTLLMTAASLYSQGWTMDLGVLGQGRMAVLPTYPFKRGRYWLSSASLDPRVRAGAAAAAEDDADDGWEEQESFTGEAIPRPTLSAEYVPPVTELEKTIAGILKRFLGFAEVGVHDNFFEFGINSVTMIHLNSLLKKKLKKDIPIVLMFEYPTVRSLAGRLARGQEAETVENGDEQRRRKFLTPTADRDIAVIGMAGKFPGAENLEQFWENLKNGVEASEF